MMEFYASVDSLANEQSLRKRLIMAKLHRIQQSTVTSALSRGGKGFHSLPLEIREMIYRNLLVASHPLECRYTGSFRATAREDGHVIENIRLLRLGILPVFQFTKEARQIFLRHNIFQTDHYNLHGFFCPESLKQHWDASFSPLIWMQELAVLLPFEQINGYVRQHNLDFPLFVESMAL